MLEDSARPEPARGAEALIKVESKVLYIKNLKSNTPKKNIKRKKNSPKKKTFDKVFNKKVNRDEKLTKKLSNSKVKNKKTQRPLRYRTFTALVSFFKEKHPTKIAFR